MAEDTVPETPADKLESEFSCSNFAKEFFQRNQKKYEVKSLALFQMCMRELLVKFKYYIGSIIVLLHDDFAWHVVPWFLAWILSKIPLLNFYSIIDFLTLMITFQLILTQRFVHWTVSNSIIKWFSLSEMEAASFLVKVEALDKRRIQLYATMRLPIEDGKIMLYHDPKWGSCLMHWLQCPILGEHEKR